MSVDVNAPIWVKNTDEPATRVRGPILGWYTIRARWSGAGSPFSRTMRLDDVNRRLSNTPLTAPVVTPAPAPAPVAAPATSVPEETPAPDVVLVETPPVEAVTLADVMTELRAIRALLEVRA